MGFTNRLSEAIKSFRTAGKSERLTDKQIEARSGEGMETINVDGFGASGLSSFNSFYSTYLNKQYKNEKARIYNYRNMMNAPEISDIVEDAVNESTQEDNEGYSISLNINDDSLNKKENVVNTLNNEFYDLFYNRIDISTNLWDLLYTYFVDGRMYFENIINQNRKLDGIINIKPLPSETMDYIYDYKHSRVIAYLQYLKPNIKKPESIEEAEKDENIIVFYPSQISFIPYQYGNNKQSITGYLEKAKIPYNQLKLLETSMIIYRIVRAPERFVFKIDVGNMPREKAMKYVEKIKRKMNRKESFDPNTGTLLNNTEILCIRQNTEIKLLDGRCLPLTKVIDEYNQGKDNWVYTVNEKTKEIEPGKIVNAQITRPNEKLIRVHLDDGNYVDTTYDHKFIMRDGSKKRADELKENDSLMPLYTKYGKIGKNDYEYVYDLKQNKWVTTHKMVCENTQRMRDKREVIHHKDFNRYNNTPGNLEIMDKTDHIRYHSNCASDFFKNFWKENYCEMCKIRREQFDRLKQDPEWVKQRSETTSYWNKKLGLSKKLLESLNEPENREKQKQGARKSKIEYFSNPENRKKQGEQMKINQARNPDAFLQNVKKPKTDDHKKKISETLKERWDNDIEYRKYHSEINKQRYIDNPELKKKIGDPQKIKTDKQIIEAMIKTCYELGNGVTLKNLSSELSNNSYFISHWADVNKDVKAIVKDRITVGSLYKIIKREGYEGFDDFKKNIRYNHKVSKIEYIGETDDTGCITVEGNHNFAISMNGKPLIFLKNSIQDNFFIPSSESRGSDISTIGGSNIGFKELDDIFYFSKKLHRALKYPLSRVERNQENRRDENLFGGNSIGEITLDEIKWAKFLERQQSKFAKVFRNLFLLHLEFKGMKKQYGLNKDNISVSFMPPSDYREQMQQNLLQTRHDNYMTLSNEPEFSKKWLMMRHLELTEEEIKENAEMKKEDKRLGLVSEEEGMGF